MKHFHARPSFPRAPVQGTRQDGRPAPLNDTSGPGTASHPVLASFLPALPSVPVLTRFSPCPRRLSSIALHFSPPPRKTISHSSGFAVPAGSARLILAPPAPGAWASGQVPEAPERRRARRPEPAVRERSGQRPDRNLGPGLRTGASFGTLFNYPFGRGGPALFRHSLPGVLFSYPGPRRGARKRGSSTAWPQSSTGRWIWDPTPSG